MSQGVSLSMADMELDGPPQQPAPLAGGSFDLEARPTASAGALALTPPQAYAALYTGRTRVVRLLQAAERGPSDSELEALRLAHAAAKEGDDAALYHSARPRAVAGELRGRRWRAGARGDTPSLALSEAPPLWP